MWSQWGRTLSLRRHDPSSAAASASPTAASTPSSPFHPSTFKDVLSLSHSASSRLPHRKPPSSIFHRVRVATSALRTWRHHHADGPSSAGNRVVLYFTSLRVVRRTFDDCSAVRSILRSFRVAVDERDLSMDSRFLAELNSLLGTSDQLALPRVFIGGRYVGGADEIRALHEAGELRRIVEGAPLAKPGVCTRCGGLTFVLCGTCNGSHKLYSEKGGGGFRTCTACNENGLSRCSDCHRFEPEED